MTLKNNTAVAQTGYLERFADIDADGAAASNRFDADKYATWGHLDHGVMMRAASGPHNVLGFVVSAGYLDPYGITPQPLPYVGDGAAIYYWGTNLAPNSSQTVTVEYRAI